MKHFKDRMQPFKVSSRTNSSHRNSVYHCIKWSMVIFIAWLGTSKFSQGKCKGNPHDLFEWSFIHLDRECLTDVKGGIKATHIMT